MVDTAGAFGPIIQSVLSSAPAVRGTVGAALADVLGASKPTAKPIVDVLLLFDSKSASPLFLAKDIGPALYGATADHIVGVDSWESLAAELRKYSTIKRLVIWAHGTPGAPRINGVEKPPTALRDFLGGTQVQVTESILWEGCETMQKPIDMSISASKIAGPDALLIGYTYSMVVRPVSVSGATVQDVQEALDKDDGYWTTKPEAETIAGKGETVLHQRWFRVIGDSTALPDAPLERRDFVKEGQLERKTIATAEDARNFQKKYDTFDTRPDGYKVTVTKIQVVAKAKAKQ